MSNPNDKKLKIQNGIIRRMIKEVLGYQSEAKMNEKRIQKMKDDGKDEYDIKKQEEVLGESYMMIPDSKNRLEAALEKFVLILEEVQEDPDLDQEILQESQKLKAEGEREIVTTGQTA